MGATTTHLLMGHQQLHTSATAGIYSLINQGKVFFQPQSLASLLILHFRDEQKCTGNADAQTDSMCPSEVGHMWRYGDGTSWHDAGKGLIVKCISETGKIRTNYRAARVYVLCTHALKFKYLICLRLAWPFCTDMVGVSRSPFAATLLGKQTLGPQLCHIHEAQKKISSQEPDSKGKK